MRIAVAGSHGVGKTTLVNALCKLSSYSMITEVARTVANEMEIKNTDQVKEADKDTIRLFQSRIFYRQLLAEAEYGNNFISDRSIFDVIAYMLFYGLESDMIGNFAKWAAIHSSNYDLIIYCPVPSAPIDKDGFRLTDAFSQAMVDRYIFNLLSKQAHCTVIELPSRREDWLTAATQHPMIKPIIRYPDNASQG